MDLHKNGSHPQNNGPTLKYEDGKQLGCRECGNVTFLPAVKISVLAADHELNAKGEPLQLQLPAVICAKCSAELDLEKASHQ